MSALTCENCLELPKELAERARKELHETRRIREEGLAYLRKRISETKLKTKTEDLHLIRFLRARKFNEDKAFQMLKTYTEMQHKEPELFSDRSVSSATEEGQKLLAGRDKRGAAMLLFKPGVYKLRTAKSSPGPGTCTVEEMFRYSISLLEKCSLDPETQVNGIVVIVDYTRFSVLDHALLLNPYYAKKTAAVLQDMFPLRFKGIHILNQPSYFDALYAVIKPFLKQKMKERIYLHGESLESLHKFIDPDVLPEEYRKNETEEKWFN